MAPAADERAQSVLADQVLAAILEIIGNGKGPVLPEHGLEKDLGIDSLEFVRLVQLVEDALDVRLDDQAAAGVVTVADLLALVAATKAAG